MSITPYERVFAVLKGFPVDRIPNLSILMTFATNNTLIAPGCEVPRDTAVGNLYAISKTLWEIADQQTDSSLKFSQETFIYKMRM